MQEIKVILKNSATVLSVYLALMIVVVVGLVSTIGAQSASGVRDCDDNAIVRCGAMTSAELAQKYDTDPFIGAVYACFDITNAAVHNLPNTAVSGQVTKAGEVIVNGQIVATGAITAGRQDMPGSTPVTCNNVNYFKRPPSVSFVSDSLDAFVVMQNGQFAYAILASCGNPIKATPVVVKKVTPPVVVVVQPKPTPTPTPPVAQPVAAPAPAAELPKTGPGNVLAIFSIVTIASAALHRFYTKKRQLSITATPTVAE